MTARSHYQTEETRKWEAGLPQALDPSQPGQIQQCPFPIIRHYRSRHLGELLRLLSAGSDLDKQRNAWDAAFFAAKESGSVPHWLTSSFDGVIAQLCFPQLRHAPVNLEFKAIVRHGQRFSMHQVELAWRRGLGQKPDRVIALLHLWMESHPQRDDLVLDDLGAGQRLMMALSTQQPMWIESLAPKYVDLLFSLDLGL